MAREINLRFGQQRKALDLQLNDFSGGVISLIDESDLPLKSAREAKNLIQIEDGTWAPRWGSAYYGVDAGGAIDGAGVFVTSDNASHLVIVAGGTVYRSTDDGASWDTCTGGTFTAGNHVKMKQIKSELWLTNGVDTMLKYDGNIALVTFAGLIEPVGLAASESGLTGTDYTYYYAVSALTAVGSTNATTEVSETVSKPRAEWASDGTEKIAVTWTAVTDATGYDVYVGTESGSLFYLTTVQTNSYDDDGTISANQFLSQPLDNTTTGPVSKDIELSGNRLWLTQDKDSPFRVFWGGTGTYQGRFSPFYGGGWVDLELGGVERPKAVKHFQDGRGTSFLTVLTADPAGNGSIWQIALETATVGDTSFTIPVVTKLVGAVGTTSYRSVITANNTVMYANQKGIHTLGPRPQLLNLLDSKEISANIRPTYDVITDSALPNINAYFYKARVFISVPYGSTTNNRIMVYDSERRNWSPEAFDFGVEGMFEYVDTDGITHLLCWKPSGTQLIEIAENIKGDLGADFSTSYVSALIPVTKSRVGFAKVKKAFIEIANPTGSITFAVSGVQKRKAFSAIGSQVINAGTSTSGWSSSLWSSTAWSDAPNAPDTFSTSSLIRYLRLNKTLGNVQFRITTSSRNDYYVLRSLYAEGFIIPTAQPSSRRL